jgi:ribosome assembly protein 4
MNINCKRLCSSSHDKVIIIWNAIGFTILASLAGHTDEVTKVIWGGEGLIYSASKDRTIKVWSANKGKIVRSLNGHAHWVNTLALSTDYVLRSSCYDHKNKEFDSKKEM